MKNKLFYMLFSFENNKMKKQRCTIKVKFKRETASIVKACIHYFYQIFIFSPNDRPSRTIKNVFSFH